MKTNISSPLTLSRSLRLWAAVLGIVCAAALAASPARADFGIQSFTSDVLGADEATPFTQAGGHPFEIVTNFTFNSTDGLLPDDRVKDVTVDLPAGFVGDPTSAPTCSYAGLLNDSACPIDAQVGIVALTLNNGAGTVDTAFAKVFNMPPAPGDVATFAFNVENELVSVHIRLRSDGDYGVRAIVHNASSFLPILGTKLTLWGEPADPSHDQFRGSCLNIDGTSNGTCPANTPPRPFLTNGSDCAAAGQPTTMAVDSWENPTDVKTFTTPPAPALTGCDQLSFDPTLTFQPSSPQAGAPSGYSMRLHVPQNGTAAGVATPALRTAVVTLPTGVSISPSSVNGLGACSDAQLGLHSLDPPQCPDSSKIGTVRIDTPVLPQPLTGHIFLGSQLPDQTFRIFLVAEGDGVRVKLSGNVDPDPVTGQVKTTFDNNPQLPFSDLTLTFDGGPHAALSSPRSCGSFTTTSDLTPYSAPTTADATPSDAFQITRGLDGKACAPAGFHPGFVAGTISPSAGRFTPFTLTFSRGDTDQELSGLSVDMPAGVLASIASVPVLCSDAQAGAGTCDAGSRVGSVTTGAGPGSDPFFLPGTVYLTGPYKGAPYGLSIVVPVIAGPFDLGTVVVRAAIFLDRDTTKLRVVSDPLPTIIDGVPLQVRTVNVNIDRPDFILNPTSCDPTQIGARISSTDGASADVSSRFQVGDCAALPFHPKLSLTVGGKGHTGKGRSTPLTATVAMTPGQANLKAVSVALPGTLNALLGVVNHACTLDAFHAGSCGAAAKVGTAVAVTPLLRDPLRGEVFFVKNPARAIPDLMVALRGPVAVDLTGKVTIPGGKRLATNFDTVPDVPITKFSLRIVSGKNGPIGTVSNLCTAKSRRATAALAFRAQSGKLVQRDETLHVVGCPKPKKHKQ